MHNKVFRICQALARHFGWYLTRSDWQRMYNDVLEGHNVDSI